MNKKVNNIYCVKYITLVNKDTQHHAGRSERGRGPVHMWAEQGGGARQVPEALQVKAGMND